MSSARESNRLKDLASRRTLDDASRKRRARKALEALEADNYHDDPHADLVMNKKAPKFNETLTTRTKKRKNRSLDYYKQRYRKTFPQLLEEDQLHRPDAPNYISIQAPPPQVPERHFCAVCGFPAPYTCVQCGIRFCAVKCLGTHKETRCLKWIS